MAVRTFSSTILPSVSKPDVFKRVIDSFPTDIQMAFAYGSGVFQQSGNEMSKNMLDFIFIVDNPEKWHEENLKVNSRHYSSLSFFGPKFISSMQENYGAGVYFNTLVPFEQRLIKYGVISTNKLISDLVTWETLYVSGRLHKPVKFVISPQSPQVCNALSQNLQSALQAALLLLPDTFSEKELFTMITSLSYSGDFRMTFGEDKGKVWKIVSPNMPYFQKLYGTVLENEKHVHWNRGAGTFEQDISPPTLLHHLNLLPIQVTKQIIACHPNRYKGIDTETVHESVIQEDNYQQVVAKGLAGIVKKSSWSQSLKGILMAGALKTTKYSYSKVKKMFKGLTTPQPSIATPR